MPTLLIADANPGMRALLKATLVGDPRLEIMEARDGLEALDRARRNLPAVMLLDLDLSGVNGFEVCRLLKAQWETKDIVILIVSALTQDHHKCQAGVAGADGFFPKPFSPLALLICLEPLLQEVSEGPAAQHHVPVRGEPVEPFPVAPLRRK